MNPFNKYLIRWIILAFMALMFCTAGAQQPIKVQGVIADSATRKPLRAATVYLLDDSSRILKTGLTKEDGSFAFPGVQGKAYRIRVSAVGYRHTQVAAAMSPVDRDLGIIYVARGVNTMNEVVVNASRPLVRQEADKIAYDLQADPESKGSSVLEMMRKVPFLSLDGDQNILLNGSASYRILINGKPSTLVERNPKEILRSMPASTIKSIEVITSPGAKYDGEGLSGIINIITHKKVDNGYNGTVNVNYRYPVGGPNTGATFGIKRGKIGLSIMGGASMYNTPNVNSSISRITTGREATTLEQHATRESHSRNQYIGTELSYDIDSLSLVSAQFNINGNKGSNWNRQYAELTMEPGLFQSYDVMNEGERRGSGLDAGLNYQKGFKSGKDRLLTFSYRYLQNQNSLLDGITIYNPVNYKTPDYNQENKERFSEQTIQVDYVQPIKKVSLEAGVKGVFRSNKSDFRFFLYDSVNKGFMPDVSRTNYFSNDQNIQAVYNSFSYKVKSWSFKGGMRLEQTKVDAHFAAGNARVRQDYFSFIPSASVSRKLKNGSTLSFNYANRIQRPSIYQLNPFVDRSNPVIDRSGNPDLEPGRGNMIQLAYNRSKKSTLNLAVTHMMFDNIIDQLSVYNPVTNRTRTRFENAGKGRITRANIFFNHPVNKKLNMRLNSDVRYIVAQIRTGNSYLKNDLMMVYASFAANYRFDNGLRLNADITGSTGGLSSIQGRSNGFLASSLGAQKDLIKDKLTFSATVSNPFSKYRHIRDKVRGTDFTQVMENNIYFRSFNLSLNYRFGKLKEAVKRNKRGISNDDVEMK